MPVLCLESFNASCIEMSHVFICDVEAREEVFSSFLYLSFLNVKKKKKTCQCKIRFFHAEYSDEGEEEGKKRQQIRSGTAWVGVRRTGI